MEPTTEQLLEIQANARRAKCPQTEARPIGLHTTNLSEKNKGKVVKDEPETSVALCPICGKHLGMYSNTTTVPVACENPRCQRKTKWLRMSQDAKIGFAHSCGAGMQYIRNKTLPTLDSFPFPTGVGVDIRQSTFITGPVGTGKTWLLNCILCDALADGFESARLESWVWFQLYIRDTYKSASGKTELEVLKQYIVPPIICLDDIGSGKDIEGKESEAARVNLYLLLDKRYYDNRTIHITSNLTIDQLGKKYDDRIASRIADMCEVIVLTKNLRKMM